MSAFEKWSVLSTALLTALTGFAYVVMKYLLEPREPWAVINHPLQPWVLKAHILVAPLLLFAVGLITMRHIWHHFRRRIRIGRRSGLAAAAVFAPMVVTGYLIQAVTAPGWLQAIAWTHILTSVVFSGGFAAHAFVVLRRGKSSGAAVELRGGTDPSTSRARVNSALQDRQNWLRHRERGAQSGG